LSGETGGKPQKYYNLVAPEQKPKVLSLQLQVEAVVVYFEALSWHCV
jgi:hypothetical protein